MRTHSLEKYEKTTAGMRILSRSFATSFSVDETACCWILFSPFGFLADWALDEIFSGITSGISGASWNPMATRCFINSRSPRVLVKRSAICSSPSTQVNTIYRFFTRSWQKQIRNSTWRDLRCSPEADKTLIAACESHLHSISTFGLSSVICSVANKKLISRWIASACWTPSWRDVICEWVSKKKCCEILLSPIASCMQSASADNSASQLLVATICWIRENPFTTDPR